MAYSLTLISKITDCRFDAARSIALNNLMPRLNLKPMCNQSPVLSSNPLFC